MTTDSLVEGLLRPEAYPPPRPTRVDLVTTHISWVFLTDHDVWKVKRPVDYGFLDYTTLEQRLHFCLEEVRLNERLAPGVYRGVMPVRLEPGGFTLNGEGPIVDYVVHMRRLPDSASLDSRLRAGTLTHDQLWAVAAVLASFYATASVRPPFGSPAVIGATVLQNLDEARPFIGRFVSEETFEAVRGWQVGFLEREGGRFEARVAKGRVRDGHGDLRLEHVYLEGSTVLVIDCVEFNERFRACDVASDAGFLAMELDGRGRPELASSFLGRFAMESNDYDLYEVVDFYLPYRAWVRGKVAALLAVDPTTPPDKAARKAGEARALFALAERYIRRRDEAAPVVAVGGLIGSGKTMLAEAVSRGLGLPVIASDRTRKWLAGVAPTERAPAEAYSPAISAQTFDEVFRRAALVLKSRRGVILDATFRERELRSRARELAQRHGRPFLFVETVCDDRVLRERLRQRAAGPSVSDATEDLLARVRAEFEPVTELPAGEHLVVDTTHPPAALAERVRAAVAGLHAAR
ncbi:MAG TPA: AAA family ATPase [Candidatus Methylomirabilis sp.]|nr:AAA family ATPase [Candidatus Methylomirabilis sp.]